jgi:hypothetical protein
MGLLLLDLLYVCCSDRLDTAERLLLSVKPMRLETVNSAIWPKKGCNFVLTDEVGAE